MTVKIARALHKSGFAHYPETAAAIVSSVPPEVAEALSSERLAMLYRAMHAHWTRAVASAESTVCSEGWVWDGCRQAGREIVA